MLDNSNKLSKLQCDGYTESSRGCLVVVEPTCGKGAGSHRRAKLQERDYYIIIIKKKEMAYNHQQHEQQCPYYLFPMSRTHFLAGTVSPKARHGLSTAHLTNVSFIQRPLLTTTQRREAPERQG